VIRIDVHPAGENRPTCHMHPTLSLRMVPDHTYLTWSMQNNLSRSPHEVKTGHYTVRNLGYHRQTGPAVTLSFLPHDYLNVGERYFRQAVTQLHQLTGPIYQHAIGRLNTCSRGPTDQSLIDTGGDYNHLRGPPSLRLTNLNIGH
jgi:hypothetical protein